MQFKVPQNIDMQDRIVGSLTLLQFVYLMAGGSIVYICFSTMSTLPFLVISIPVAILTLCLTFLKVQDQPFSHFLGSLALYVTRPRKRIWQKSPEMEVIQITQESKTKKEEKKVFKQKTLSEVNIDELSYVLDTHGMKKINEGIDMVNNNDKLEARNPKSETN